MMQDVAYPIKPKLSPPIWVDTAHALDQMCARLLQAPVVSVDTESNSLYAYTERVCLIQFSIPEHDYVFDSLALEDLSALDALFSDQQIVKIFHAAEYDVMALRRDHGFTFANLFDTMIASRIVGWKRYGLGNLLKVHFDVETNKRMQRTNWGRRPLTPEQLAYARLDTHYLIDLRDLLLSELEQRRRLEEAQLAFAAVAQSQWTGKSFDPDGFWRVKGARDLAPEELAVLKALYVYRDRRAQALDRPPFKVMGDSALVSLSQACPQTLSELSRIKGIPRRLSTKRRRQLLRVIAEGHEQPSPKRPSRHRGPRLSHETSQRYEALRAWRKERSQARGVEPDVILSNNALSKLAQLNPRSMTQLKVSYILNDWQRQTYGQEIVRLLKTRGDK